MMKKMILIALALVLACMSAAAESPDLNALVAANDYDVLGMKHQTVGYIREYYGNPDDIWTIKSIISDGLIYVNFDGMEEAVLDNKIVLVFEDGKLEAELRMDDIFGFWEERIEEIGISFEDETVLSTSTEDGFLTIVTSIDDQETVLALMDTLGIEGGTLTWKQVFDPDTLEVQRISLYADDVLIDERTMLYDTDENYMASFDPFLSANKRNLTIHCGDAAETFEMAKGIAFYIVGPDAQPASKYYADPECTVVYESSNDPDDVSDLDIYIKAEQ